MSHFKSTRKSLRSGFTLIELLVVISIIALLLGILVPVLGIAKKNAAIMSESVNLRNTHVGLVTFGSTNKDWFSGLNSKGNYQVADFLGKQYGARANTAVLAPSATTALIISEPTNYALAQLLEEGALAPKQLVSSGETNGYTTGGDLTSLTITEVVPCPAGETVAVAALTATTGAAVAASYGQVADNNCSFALMAYSQPKLKQEWKSNQNNQSIALATRMIFTQGDNATTGQFSSIWTNDKSGKYRGNMTRNDSSTNPVSFAASEFAGNACPADIANLKYGGTVFTHNAALSGTIAGVFGAHATATNFDASETKAQLASMND